jgi:hypothetical protein
MPAILDPYYSRPIDVHRWSEHPEVADFVESIWTEHFEDMAVTKPGPKPKTPFKDQLKILLLDCYVAWLEDPELSIGISMNANSYHTGSRYNALHISKHMIQVVQRLVDVGLLDMAKGSYGGAGIGSNRTTRIRPSDALQAMFRGTSVVREDIHRIETEECIILRGVDDRLQEYDDTEETGRKREELRAYNRVLADNFIDQPEFADQSFWITDDYGKERKQHIGPSYQFIRRIYSRGNWTLHGRFYGGWWQMLNSTQRSKILINNNPTVEVDFMAQHLHILSAEQGVEIATDPYELPVNSVPGTPEALQRKIVKKLLLTALNAPDRRSAFGSFRGDWPKGHMAKKMTNEDLDNLMKVFLEHQPHLSELVFADQGIRLMNVDSQIMERVHRNFTQQGIPVLSVHDSCIIEYTHAGQLKQVMQAASEEVVGRPLPISANGIGLDEVDNEHSEDLIAWRQEQVKRSEGYLERLAAWASASNDN